MEITFEELSNKTAVQLREIAKEIEHETLHGSTTMHKEQLLRALCKALGIEAHEHHALVGIDKGKIKARIRELKSQRDAALQAHDDKQLKVILRQIHHLKHRLRSATV